MTKEELLAEEHICNGKCQDDITRNYVHCKTCTRLKDFFSGYKAGKAELEAQIEKMKKYIKACWIEENLNDYSSYITNNSDEFRDLVKEINDEVRNGR